MDYWGVVREAWSVTRRTRPLWWLGTISAAQLIVYSIIVTMLALPMAAVPALVSQQALSTGQGGVVDPAAAQAQAAADGFRERALVGISRWLSANWPLLIGGIVGVLALWVVLGIFDVAAQPGLITQATAEVEGRTASVGAGMRDGFRLWWRTVGLLAIAVLPGLLYLLAMAMVMFYTVSLPLYQGHAPNGAGALSGQLMLSPLSTLVTIVTIPLGVIVQLGLRFAVIDDAEWRPAFRRGWDLLRTRLAEVALMWLTIFAVTLLASLPVSLVLGFVVAVGAVAVFVPLAAGGTFTVTGGIVGVVAAMAVLATILLLAYSAALFTFTSVVWTLFWRRLTGRDPLRAPVPASAAPARPAAAYPPPPLYPPPPPVPPTSITASEELP